MIVAGLADLRERRSRAKATWPPAFASDTAGARVCVRHQTLSADGGRSWFLNDLLRLLVFDLLAAAAATLGTLMESASTADPTSRPAAQRLRDALVRLTADNTSEAPTASALCAIAGVSRNALYRYRPDILQELHKLQRQRHRDPGSARRALQQLRDEYKDLCQQVTNLASLVDHYFAAWQEASSMLQRRERELADLRKGAKPKLVSLRG